MTTVSLSPALTVLGFHPEWILHTPLRDVVSGSQKGDNRIDARLAFEDRYVRPTANLPPGTQGGVDLPLLPYLD